MFDKLIVINEYKVKYTGEKIYSVYCDRCAQVCFLKDENIPFMTDLTSIVDFMK